MPNAAAPGPLIAIGGENLIDRVQTGIAAGQPVFANNPGGSPYNVAIALARQCGHAHYLTPISTDAMGCLLAERLHACGVTLAAPRRPEPTTLAVVTLNDGAPSYEFHRTGTAERCVTKASILDSLPTASAVFHVGSLALVGGADADAWEGAFLAAKRAGCLLSLDPNVRPSLIDDADGYRNRIFRMVAAADLIKLSDEDLAWLYPDLAESQALDALCDEAGRALVVLTRGGGGALAKLGATHITVSAHPVPQLADTIGAGDTFMGTLLGGLADMDAATSEALASMDDAALGALLRRAAVAAALNCARDGCDPPTGAELEAALAAGSQ